jgi:glycosyltransferase involved in cell wall biosynthesis
VSGSHPADRLVSVVTPCHNAGPFVAETIESVLAQTHPGVEQVIVDDASTDESWTVIERYAAAHPERVRGLRLEQNRGGCFARNRGAELARGEYLMFLDADDVIAPDTLAALADAVRDRPGTIGICPWRRLHRDPDGTWRETPPDLPRLPPSDADAALRGWLAGTGWAPPCAMLWRRDAYEMVGGWDEALARNQDGDIAMRALAAGALPVRANGGTAYYRAHDDSRVPVSRNFIAEDKFRSQIRVMDKIAALLEQQGRVHEFRLSLGGGYRRVALVGFQGGHRELARECLRKGARYAGRRTTAVSPTPPGRLLERLLGMERKERLVQGLARYGVMTPQRRRLFQLRATHADRSRDGSGGAG